MKDLSGAEKDKDWLGATRGHEVMWEPLDVTDVLRLLNEAHFLYPQNFEQQ